MHQTLRKLQHPHGQLYVTGPTTPAPACVATVAFVLFIRSVYVQVSACDARLTAFYGLTDATRCWIKGRQFSLAGLLADRSESQHLASQFDGGCMMLYRLAPQV